MKKFIMLLVLGVLMFLPMRAMALSFAIDEDKLSCTDCEETGDQCVTICTVAIKDSTETLEEIVLSIVPATGVTISDITPFGNWTFSGSYSSATFTNLLGETNSAFTLFTFKQTFDKSITDCSPMIRLVDGKEYIVPVPEPTEEPAKTGVSLPVVILVGGAVLAITLYTITNKNKKMYKI